MLSTIVGLGIGQEKNIYYVKLKRHRAYSNTIKSNRIKNNSHRGKKGDSFKFNERENKKALCRCMDASMGFSVLLCVNQALAGWKL